MHYGTPLGDTAEAAARERHHYPEAVGWLYRVVANRYAAVHHDGYSESGHGEWYTTGPTLEVFAFPVLRWTPKGATIKDIWGRRSLTRWVNLEPGSKQYASRTATEAVEQLAERRRRQLYILAKQTRRAQEELALCEKVAHGGCNLLPIG